MYAFVMLEAKNNLFIFDLGSRLIYQSQTFSVVECLGFHSNHSLSPEKYREKNRSLRPSSTWFCGILIRGVFYALQRVIKYAHENRAPADFARVWLCVCLYEHMWRKPVIHSNEIESDTLVAAANTILQNPNQSY